MQQRGAVAASSAAAAAAAASRRLPPAARCARVPASRRPTRCAPPISTRSALPVQGNIKRDPAGYADEFQMQWRHYQACLQLFVLKPDQDGGDFGDLVNFIAQVRVDAWACSC